MIKFVDVNTGNVFDGSAPYTHWMEQAKSVGLNYSKKFILISDTGYLRIKLDSDVFSLVDDTKLTEFVKKHKKDYLDLSKITTNRIDIYGVPHRGVYVFSFNIIGKGVYVGEVIDQFYINEEAFNIGADFVDENEALSTNLSNFGMDMPNEVQRSIYVQNIHEQKPDYILLNRKYKELLNEYINIIANKGSYKSLINSLNWFEYGDLVHLYEYWRHEEPTRKMLSKNDISQYVNEKLENVLTSFQKTTYISICCALTNCKKVNGEIVYMPELSGNLHSEPIPEVENVSMLWSRTEMSLKMVLLSNFFATYFMPIHLDLIHCSVEDVVFPDTIKVGYVPKFERFDYVDNAAVLTCKVNELYHLDNIEVFTNNDTAFGITNKTNFTEEDDVEILGVEQTNDTSVETITQARLMTKHFKGIGVIIPFECKCNQVSSNNFITTGHLYIYKDGILLIERDTTKIPHIPDSKGEVEIDFNLLIKEAGDYTVQITFSRADGMRYAKTVTFKVDGERYQNISLYKMVPRYVDYADRIINFNIDDWVSKFDDNHDVIFNKNIGFSIDVEQQTIENKEYIPSFGSIADYVLDPVAHSRNKVYMQFFACSSDTLESNVKLNQVIIAMKPGIHEKEAFMNHFGFNNQDGVPVRADDGQPQDYSFSGLLQRDDLKYVRYVKHKKINTNPSDPEILVDLEGDYETYFFIINMRDHDDPHASEYYLYPDSGKFPERKNGEKYWFGYTFIPYFYTLKKAGEVTFAEEVLEKLSEEEIYRRQNSEDAYKITQGDVICFLPELNRIKEPNDFMWKFINQSTNKEITPILFRDSVNYLNPNKILPTDNLTKVPAKEYDVAYKPKDYAGVPRKITKAAPTILQPVFGRYDFSILPKPGFYDIVMNYKLDDNEHNQTRTVSSQFLVSK